MNTESHIEAILFYKGENISKKELAELLSVSIQEIEVGLDDLERSLEGRGLTILRDGEDVAMETAPDASETVEKLIKNELSRDIGKAGLEVLTLVLYRGPISRREIDQIRGVNSSFILRNLLIRGLVERGDGMRSERSYVYKPTIELLSFLGIRRREDLPEYTTFRRELDEYKRRVDIEEKKEYES